MCVIDQRSDKELMARVRDGDFAALDALYRRHQRAIRRFLMSLTWNEDTAEDYLQEVFCNLWKARGRYQPTGTFTTYLFQIAKNHYLSERRRQKRRSEIRRQAGALHDGRHPLADIPANRRVEPEARLLAGYRLFRIREAIGQLPEGQKLVFVLAHLEGMPYDTIARVLDIPVGTVKSRMSGAVRRLQGLLQEIKP